MRTFCNICDMSKDLARSAPTEEKDSRKRRLIVLPAKFRDMRDRAIQKREIGVSEPHVLYFDLPGGLPHEVSFPRAFD
jgi:hypothetical protein